MTALIKFVKHLEKLLKEAERQTDIIINSKHDIGEIHHSIEKMIDNIISMAELAYTIYRQSDQISELLNQIDDGELVNKINNIRQILMLSENMEKIDYIRLADGLSNIEPDMLDYSIRELDSKNPEGVRRLKDAIERWERK